METNFGQLLDNFETILGPHGDYLLTIGGAYLCSVGIIWLFLLFYNATETLIKRKQTPVVIGKITKIT